MYNQAKPLLVIGSGIIGLSTALSMLQQGFKVILHSSKENPQWHRDQIDIRVSSINLNSIEMLQQLGVWQQLVANNPRVNYFSKISLLHRDPELQDKNIEFNSQNSSYPYLGAFVENNSLTQELLELCNQNPNFTLYITDQLDIKMTSPGTWLLNSPVYQGELEFIVACDGANSYWSKKLHFPTSTKSYPYKCMLALIKIELDQQQLQHTWQILGDQAPLALLPLDPEHAILCYYDTNQQFKLLEQQLKGKSEQQQLVLVEQLLSNKYQAWLSDFKLEKFGSFQLGYSRALEIVKHKVVLLGDAAHLITPMLGQGVNFGLLDLQRLNYLLQDESPEMINSVLNTYNRQTKHHYQLSLPAFDLTQKLFTEQQLLFTWLQPITKLGLIEKSLLQTAVGKGLFEQVTNAGNKILLKLDNLLK